MTNQEIYELMAHFGRSGLQGLKLSQGDFSIELQKAVSAPAAVPAAPAVQAPPAAPAAARKEGPAITAPLVGTFYAAPAPEQPPFVAPGDRVEKGQAVARVTGLEVAAAIPGIVRGLLPRGLPVTRGMKAGDIDPRCRREHCFTGSDKARAIGGGVLEGLLHFSR